MPGLQNNSAQVLVYMFRQPGIDKAVQNFFITQSRHGQCIQVIFLHELIENLGAENDGMGNGNRHIRIFPKKQVFFQKAVEKGETPGLATDGTFTDPRKTDILIIQMPVEFGNNSLWPCWSGNLI